MRPYPYSPVLGWSASRYQAFQRCRREYYYRYYGVKDADIDQAKLALLRGLTTIPLETGNVVHHTLATLVRRLKRTAAPLDVRRFRAFGRRQARKALAEKKLMGVYYGEAPGPDEQELIDKVERCLNNFLASRWYRWLTTEAIDYRGEWVVEPGDYGEIRIGGYKAYCRVDFAFPVADGSLYVLEWKTGKPQLARHNAQMRGYVAYARETFAKAPSNVQPVLVYLSDPYSELSLTITDDDLRELASRVREQTEEMYHYCADVQLNVPLPCERFPKTDERTTCHHCNFRELCGRWP